jgi:hypothetical protein
MSLISPIPIKIRNQLSSDPFMRVCCLLNGECEGRIEFHHNLIFAGKRINAAFCILPLCTWHHAKEKTFKRELDVIMVNRANKEELAPYCKVINYEKLRLS